MFQAKDVDDLVAWRSLVSMQLDGLLKDNAILRLCFAPYFDHAVYPWDEGC